MYVEKPFLSIITPVYNRAELLMKCYTSLCQQTDYDFEWIIIDDGSTDKPDSVVEKFQRTSFPIYYRRKQNGGKHTALNASHDLIHGEYVLILDSDDILTKDAVSEAKKGWKEWKQDKTVGIVTFLKGESTDKPNCIVLDWNIPVDIMRYKRKCIRSSDCCEIIRTELFKKYPFPVYEGEKFLAEGALWGRVSHDCKCVYQNKVIYLCEYLEDGLTKAGRAMRIHNPQGGMFHANVYMAKNNFWKNRIKNGLLYTCYGFFAKKTFRQMLDGCCDKLLMTLCLPLGWILYERWKS